ncbi:hypothetical protein [Streptomyces diastaticus]
MPPETTAAAAESAPASAGPTVLVQFLTLGGADVDLYKHRFETRYLPIGRPYVSDHVRTVDGFRWQCRGCGEVGQPALFTTDYLPKELAEARTHANSHASACRSKPRPSGT